MKLEIGQNWISKEFPHENFKIYDGIIDTCCDGIKDYTLEFNKQPEASKIFFWERTNLDEFNKFLVSKNIKGDNTYPYANCGESKKGSLVSKIKKYNMKLQ